MRPREWFLVGIRVFGAWPIYRGVMEFTNLLSVALDAVPKNYLDTAFGGSDWTAAKNYALYAVVNLAFGSFLFFGGEGLTKWVFDEYPRERDDEAGEADS